MAADTGTGKAAGAGQASGPVALVTGGGTGLGLAISRQLGEHGFRLAISYSRSEAEAKAAVEQLRADGREAALFRANIADGKDVASLVEGVYATYGRLDVLVNNAGATAFIPFDDIKAADEASWDAVMDVNLKGTYLMCRAAALRMLEGEGGAIVNIASTAGVVPSGSSIVYAVSKAGIIHLTKALSIGLAPKIRVNCVAPALMQTRWWDGHDEAVRRWMEGARFQKAADVADVARAVVLLATNGSISGQTLVIDQANMFL